MPFDSRIPADSDSLPRFSFKQWRPLLPLFLCTAAWGMVTVMLGPLLPALTARWHLQDAQAGTLFTTSFIGQLLGAWFATRNLRVSLLLGAALCAAGTATLAWTGFHAAHLALFAAGFGLSLGITAGNVVAGTATTHSARALALFNVSWSLGAIACPALVHLCGPSNTQLFFFITAAFVLFGGLSIATLPRDLTTSRQLEPSAPSHSLFPLPLSLLTLFAASMLLYLGNENSLGGWLPSFAARNTPTLSASTIALLFWLSELIGRLLMGPVFRRISESALYRISLPILLSTQAALLLFPHPPRAIILSATILTGLSLAPIYPLIVAFLLQRTGRHPRLGHVFAFASLGGASLPWLTGAVSTHFSSLRIGLLVPMTGILLLLLLAPGILPPRPPTQHF
ncbi:MAG TPA: MFS transporter [Edaphobacter sp.]